MNKQPMDHEQLAQRIEHRLDKIEEKLDHFLVTTTNHDSDINWIKGSLKFTLTFMIAIASGVITSLIKLFVKA